MSPVSRSTLLDEAGKIDHVMNLLREIRDGCLKVAKEDPTQADFAEGVKVFDRTADILGKLRDVSLRLADKANDSA